MFVLRCWAFIPAWRFNAYCGQPAALGGGAYGRVVQLCWEFEQVNPMPLELREKSRAGTL